MAIGPVDASLLPLAAPHVQPAGEAAQPVVQSATQRFITIG